MEQLWMEQLRLEINNLMNNSYILMAIITTIEITLQFKSKRFVEAQ
jgi:hypothetical protein